MARERIHLEHQRDYTGGLNVHDDPYNLGKNQSFDLLNVDMARAGGFGVRRGRRRHFTVGTGFAAGAADTLYIYKDAAGASHTLAARDGEIKEWNGAGWTVRRAASAKRARFVEFKDKLYIYGNRAIAAHSWDGVAAATTALAAPGYNDNLAAPVGGKSPQAQCAAVHHQVLWVGNLSASEACRVRWSHPGQPEDWRTNDFIDIDPNDENGEIRALVPFGDRLIVFKDKAVYAIHGYPPAGFSVQNLTKEIGAPSPEAVSVTEDGLFFYDTTRGAFAWDGSQFHWVFRTLAPFILDNHVNNPFADAYTVTAWHNERFWVTVPWTKEPFAGDRMTFVYYPMGGQNGTWTLHDNGPNCWYAYNDIGSDPLLLGAPLNTGGIVFQYDTPDLYSDENGSGVAQLIDAWYTTRWFDDGNPAIKKRWKRPVVVVNANADQEILVDLMIDYDPTQIKRTFKISTAIEGDELIWDVGNWDEKYWAREIGLTDRSTVLRGNPLGNGVAVALRFKCVQVGVGWKVHGLTMKWIPRKVRN